MALTIGQIVSLTSAQAVDYARLRPHVDQHVAVLIAAAGGVAALDGPICP
jgi:hypothetical protein